MECGDVAFLATAEIMHIQPLFTRPERAIHEVRVCGVNRHGWNAHTTSSHMPRTGESWSAWMWRFSSQLKRIYNLFSRSERVIHKVHERGVPSHS